MIFSIINPRWQLQAFRELSDLLTQYRQLTWEMTRREISERYAGQVLGTLWAVGHPLALMLIYVIVFTYVFKMRAGGSLDMPLSYPAYLLCGLIPWMAFQDSMAQACTVITSSANLVKQVIFPIEVLPVKGVLACLVSQTVSVTLLVIYVLLTHGYLHWTYLLLPPVMIIQALGMIGVSYTLAAVGVYFRDLKDFVMVFCTGGLYIMPAIYLPQWTPEFFKPVLYANPFSYLVWCYQDICYFGRFEHPWAWVVFLLGSIGVFCGGYRLFRKSKVMFGNVL